MLSLLQALAIGIPATLAVTALAFLFGLIGALPLLFMSRSALLPVRAISRVTIDLLRGIPPIVWLFIMYFGIASGQFKLSAFQAGVVGLGLIASAFLAEIFRGAIAGVPAGQVEAARALGMSKHHAFWLIISPQAIRIAIPAIVTYLIGLLKDSSFVSTIGVMEILFFATSMSRGTGLGLIAFFAAALLYIALSIPIAWAGKHIDLWMQPGASR